MGRMLTVQTFGEMNALFSMMVILGIPFASITNYLAKNISLCCATGNEKFANYLIISTYRKIFLFGFIAFLISLPLAQPISGALQIQSSIPVMLLFLSILISLILPVNTGILQGIQAFKSLSILFAGSSLSRYVICVTLVFLGMELNGIMIGSILAVASMGYMSFTPIRKHLKNGKDSNIPEGVEKGSLMLPILMANMSFALFTQSDIILVKYFFSPQEAGIYSSASVLGKAVMYLPGAIVTSLFPMVASNMAKNKGTLHLLLKSLAITCLLSGGGALILFMFPETIISFFFGERFVAAAPIIGKFAVAMLPLAIVLVIMNYNLAKGSKIFPYIMLAFAIIQISAITLAHNSLGEVLNVIFYTGSGCAVALLLMLTFEYFHSGLHRSARGGL